MPNAFICILDMGSVAVGHVATEWYVAGVYAAKGQTINEWLTEGCVTDEQTTGPDESLSLESMLKLVNGCRQGHCVMCQVGLVLKMVGVGGYSTVCTSAVQGCCNSLACISADSIAWAASKACRSGSANSLRCVL